MFTKMVATSPSGGLLTLQLGDTSSGFYVQEFTGLDPVKSNIVSSAFANQDGNQFQSSRRDTRNITIKIGLDPDPAVTTVRALRNQLYNIFQQGSPITMKFYVDDTDDSVEDGYQVVGYVESVVSPMFVQEPTVDISVICMDPDFIDPVTVSTTGMTTADTAYTHFPYAGTVPTGVVFTLNINATMSEFVIYYQDANNVVWTMDFQYSLVAGDVVKISTVRGNKYATLTRSGVITSVLSAIPLQATWPQLAPGDNWLKVSASGVTVPVTVDYTKRFSGL